MLPLLCPWVLRHPATRNGFLDGWGQRSRIVRQRKTTLVIWTEGKCAGVSAKTCTGRVRSDVYVRGLDRSASSLHLPFSVSFFLSLSPCKTKQLITDHGESVAGLSGRGDGHSHLFFQQLISNGWSRLDDKRLPSAGGRSQGTQRAWRKVKLNNTK